MADRNCTYPDSANERLGVDATNEFSRRKKRLQGAIAGLKWGQVIGGELELAAPARQLS